MSSLTTDALFSVRGKVVLVTGGSRGIGEMIAAGFLANGAKVYISSRKADACDATAARLAETYGAECISIPADLSELDGIDELAATLSGRESRLDVLVNNAGRLVGRVHRRVPGEGLGQGDGHQRQGRLLPDPAVAAAARGRRHRRGSGTGDQHRLGRRDPHAARSTPSPTGRRRPRVHALTSQLPPSLVKRNILVNAIAPGPFPTWMLSTGVGTGGDVEGTDWDALGRTMPRGRIGTPEDIAGLAIFLASRAGAFTVGAIITCDGGAVVS